MLPYNLAPGHYFQTWGLTFGAQMWQGEPLLGRYTLSTPEWREAFAWLQGYYQRYTPEIGHWERRLVCAGLAHRGTARRGVSYAHDAEPGRGRDFIRMGCRPADEAGERRPLPGLVRRTKLALGRHSEHADAAFDFLIFLTHSAEGSVVTARHGFMPAFQDASGLRYLVEQDPKMLAFVNILPEATGNNYTPPISGAPAAYQEFVARIFARGEAVPSALEDLERVLNARASEAGFLADR